MPRAKASAESQLELSTDQKMRVWELFHNTTRDSLPPELQRRLDEAAKKGLDYRLVIARFVAEGEPEPAAKS